MTIIKGTLVEADLPDVELDSLRRQEAQHEEAIAKAKAVDGEAYAVRTVDLAREQVSFERYWVEHTWLNIQEERAHLGLDWIPAETSETTEDRKPIVHGLRVWTNNLERGVIDLSRASWSNARGGTKSLWFDVVLDGSGRRELQNSERVITVFKGESA